jgi:hypothetical protein
MRGFTKHDEIKLVRDFFGGGKMDPVTQLISALVAAAIVVGLFAFLRWGLRNPACPPAANGVLVAYLCAVALTLGFAGSLFYLGVALSPFIGGMAILATFGIHLGLVALFQILLPAATVDRETLLQAQGL